MTHGVRYRWKQQSIRFQNGIGRNYGQSGRGGYTQMRLQDEGEGNEEHTKKKFYGSNFGILWFDVLQVEE